MATQTQDSGPMPPYILLMFKEVFEWMFRNKPHGFVGDFEYEGKKYHVDLKITETTND